VQLDSAQFALPVMPMNRPVEMLQDFNARIAAIIGAEPEQIPSTPKSNPLLVRKKRVVRTQKRRRRR
jgi:hypothetical protein